MLRHRFPMTNPDDLLNLKPVKLWGLGAGLATWLISVILIFLVPTVATIAYIAATEPSLLSGARMGEVFAERKDLILVNILAVIPAHLFTLAFAWFIVTANGNQPFFRSLGWEWGGFKWWHGAAILIGFMAVSAVVTQVIPEQEHELLRLLKSSRSAVYAVAFLATFTAPLVEEVIYRGVLYSPAEKQLGKTGAVVLVTVLFSIIHVPQYLPSASTIIMIFLLSLTLTLLRTITGNLLPCVALHLVFNGLQSARLIADPFLEHTSR